MIKAEEFRKPKYVKTKYLLTFFWLLLFIGPVRDWDGLAFAEEAGKVLIANTIN